VISSHHVCIAINYLSAIDHGDSSAASKAAPAHGLNSDGLLSAWYDDNTM